MLAILLLAAGRSSRMGDRDKLLEEVDGQPLLRIMAERALITGAPVNVVLAPDRPERLKALGGLSLTLTEASDAHLGMAHSLRAGIKALPKAATAAMVLPADMPEITTEDFLTLCRTQAETPDAILRATSETGKPGHPVVFPAALFPDLAMLSGDQGARSILKAHAGAVTHVPLPANHALTDLDTPDDWARWRLSRNSGPPT